MCPVYVTLFAPCKWWKNGSHIDIAIVLRYPGYFAEESPTILQGDLTSIHKRREGSPLLQYALDRLLSDDNLCANRRVRLSTFTTMLLHISSTMLAAFFMATSVAAAPTELAEHQSVVKIMPLGDSITGSPVSSSKGADRGLMR
jgi:hypothetical protein